MSTIKVGDVFNIEVNIKNGRNVYALSSFIVFPTDAIEILVDNNEPEISKGSYFGDNIGIRTNIAQNTELGVSMLEILYSLRSNSAQEKEGDGKLFSIKAKAKKSGKHVLLWHSNSTILNKEQKKQPNSFENYVLDITTNGNENQVNVVYITVDA